MSALTMTDMEEIELTKEEKLVLKRLAQASIVFKVILIPSILGIAGLIAAYEDIIHFFNKG